MITFYCTVGKG